MASLFDQLQERLQTQAPAPGQAQVADVLQTKTGKQITRRGPAASQMQATAAKTTQQQGERQLGVLTKTQDAGLQQKATQVEQQKKAGEKELNVQRGLAEQRLTAKKTASATQIGAQREEATYRLNAYEKQKIRDINHQAKLMTSKLATDYSVQTNELFADLRRSEADLDQRKDAALIHQRMHLISMADEAYVAEITRIGRQRQMHKEQSWRSEMHRMVLGNELMDVMERYELAAFMNMETRRSELAQVQMDANAASEILAANAAAANTQSIVQGVSQASSGVIEYAYTPQQRDY